MSHQKENPFISFYGQHSISPVRQDLSDLKEHLRRREKLYRSLGLSPFIFSGRKVLEVGPGGGYNSLAFLMWGAQMVFVEPNPQAQAELPALLMKQGIQNDQWILYPCKIEDYETSDKYDLIFAEGFIPGLWDRKIIITKLADLVSLGGVVTVTCIDDISFFFENLKRLVAFKLTKDVLAFDEKVRVLVKAFKPHLETLKHASRLVEDWVVDQFLNPALYAELFSIADCVQEFGQEFEMLGSSPSMFTDYSWYKDTEHDRQKDILEQFNKKRHNLIYWELPETLRPEKDNEELAHLTAQLRRLSGEYEISHSSGMLSDIINLVERIRENMSDLDPRIGGAIQEAKELLLDDLLTEDKVASASKFANAFGRGQQYVSMVRKFTD